MSSAQTPSKQSEHTRVIRPPVVVVMGHVDHGKTTLIDYIRKSKVAEKESGGITQAIGAYEITHQGKRVTVIDTPGHEAFSKIRSRGARVADIAILVVAADDGVQPQTKEAIEHIRAAKIPFLVALNKVDKPNINLERIRTQLAEQSVLLETWGGDVPSVEISGKTGAGVDALLDLMLLVAEMNNLTTNPQAPGQGIILESRRDSHKGVSVTALILDGVVRIQDYIVIGHEYGKIKSLIDFLGKPLKEARASSPVVVYGFSEKVTVGAPWQVVPTLKDAEALTKKYAAGLPEAKNAESKNTLTGKKTLRIILKSDVYGSKEALEGMISKLNYKEVGVEIMRSEVGDIGEEDLKLAKTTGARVFGFNVKFLSQIETSSKMLNVDVVIKDIIYELIDAIRDAMASLLTPEIIREEAGEVLILAVFGKERDGVIIGGKVTKGKVLRGASVEVVRGGAVVGTGTIRGLQSMKAERDEVSEGKECGIFFSGSTKIEVRDILRVYTEQKILPKLE